MPVPRAGDSEQTPITEWSFEDFGSLNTKVSRPAVQDNEFFWNENWMPIATGRLRTMYAEGTSLFTGATIVYGYAYSIAGVAYWALFFNDGTAKQVRVSDGAVTVITATTNTFYNSGVSTQLPACAQFQNKYLAICTNISTSGYWLWDGSNLFSAGTLSPDSTITNAGSGYSSTPTVTITGGSGSGATATAVVKNNTVTQITITNPGSGYALNDQPVATITGGGSDNAASATATIATTSGGLGQVYIINGGTGYTTSSTATLTGGGGSGGQVVITGLSNGTITSIAIIAPGSGYTSAPVLTFSSGSGGSFSIMIANGTISGVTLVSGGSGYYGSPTVTIVGDGTGAVVTAQISGGAVTGFTVVNGGKNYTKASVVLSGGNKSASATVSIMPFQVQGTTIETYQNRVWLANGVNLIATGPGTVANFATSAGGVLTQLTDASLRTQITRLAQANGFLYGFGDSSVFSVTNVQTSTTGTTTYNISNVDPQIGTAWRDSVVALGRALIFANPSGVYALYGGAAEKVSNPLDGLFLNANFASPIPSAAVATIFNIRCYMLNFTTFDPYQSQNRTIMALWDGNKWFVGSQLKTPKFIQTQEINSIITAWAIDGTHLYPMWQTPSTSLNKVFQTKLRKAPTYTSTKRSLRLYFVAANNGTDINPTFAASSDTEVSNGAPVTFTLKQTALSFVGAGGTIQFQNSSNVNINFYPTNVINVDAIATSTYGKMLGYTLTTTGSDLDIISLTAHYGDFAPYG